MPLLKLKNARYTDPEQPTLVNEFDLGRDGSKWRHGWIPLNPSAVAIKEKKAGKGGGGKSRLSTSDTRPSRLKLKGDRGRVHEGPKTPVGPGDKHKAETSIEARQRITRSMDSGALGRAFAAKTPKSELTAAEHVRLSRAHNEAGMRALAAGDKEAADRHVTKAIEHNDAAVKMANAGDLAKLRESGDRGKALADTEISRRVASRPRTAEEADAALKAKGMEPGSKVRVGAFTAPNPAFSEGASPDTHTVVKAARNGNVTVRHDPSGSTHDVAFERLSPVAGARDPKTTDDRGKLRTLGGYGVNDLRKIAKNNGGTVSPETVAAAQAELRARGYVLSHPGTQSWVKPKAPAPPKRNRNTSNGLSTSASIREARSREITARNSREHRLGGR